MKIAIVISISMLCLFATAQNIPAKSTTIALASNETQLVQETLKGMLYRVQDQVEQLASAFEEEQYDWKPAEGIRSVRESILHVAAANYFLATKLGYTPPADTDFMTMEVNIKGKENVLAALKKSNEFILSKITEEKAENFGSEVDFGFAKFNRLAGLLIILEHAGEHKGQLIAYARSNNVTPPWSQQ